MLKQFLENAVGMEMVEWAIVGITFATALAVAWTPVAAAVTAAVSVVAASM